MIVVVGVACTRSSTPDEVIGGGPTTTTTVPATVTAAPVDVADTDDAVTQPSAGSAAPSTTAPIDLATPTASVSELPEVGVPGLDSTDAFCAAWSRFAGSFQVVAVTAAFGSGPPEALASLEVAAAPTVGAAYEQLVANWPDELAPEADVVAQDFLGPFARRLAAAQESLLATGADSDIVGTIDAAWVAGLAGRDPSTPEFVVDLPDEVWAVVDAAAADFAGRLVPFGTDPSLVTDVDTPLTSAYLAVSCPDQGTLSGQEVDTP